MQPRGLNDFNAEHAEAAELVFEPTSAPSALNLLFVVLIVFTVQSALAADAAPEADPAKLAELEKLGKQDDESSRQQLLKVLQDAAAHSAERETALKALVLTKAGGLALLNLAEQDKLPVEFTATASFACASSSFEEVRKAGEAKLPVPRSKDNLPLPPPEKLATMTGDAARGAKVFRDTKGGNCISCHQIGEEGKFVGPPLQNIGGKVSKRQILESILTPSANIVMGMETWVAKTKSGEIKTGLLAENTDDHITIKDAKGDWNDIPLDQLAKKTKLTTSMMPEDLVKTMTQQELLDLVEYLSTLKY